MFICTVNDWYILYFSTGRGVISIHMMLYRVGKEAVCMIFIYGVVDPKEYSQRAVILFIS